MAVETPSERAVAVSRVLAATEAEPKSVKQAAVDALVATGDGVALADTAAAVEKVLNENQSAPNSVKAAAVAAVASQAPIPGPPAKDVTGLWWALVIGLLVLLFATLVGLLWTVLDGKDNTSADKVLIVFTPLLTGLLGLFAPSPRQTSTGSQQGA